MLPRRELPLRCRHLAPAAATSPRSRSRELSHFVLPLHCRHAPPADATSPRPRSRELPRFEFLLRCCHLAPAAASSPALSSSSVAATSSPLQPRSSCKLPLHCHCELAPTATAVASSLRCHRELAALTPPPRRRPVAVIELASPSCRQELASPSFAFASKDACLRSPSPPSCRLPSPPSILPISASSLASGRLRPFLTSHLCPASAPPLLALVAPASACPPLPHLSLASLLRFLATSSPRPPLPHQPPCTLLFLSSLRIAL